MKKTVTYITAILAAAGSMLPLGAISQTISAGINFGVSVCTDNKAMSWGYGGEGQLGDSTFSSSLTPMQVHGLSNVIAVSSGGAHTLALKSDGTVWGWGYNLYASLGIGVIATQVDTATKVVGLSNVIAISAGGYHSLALKADGTVWSWGSNFAGEIGDGTVSTRATPVQVTGISGITAISAGAIHSMALKSNGDLYAWGLNSDGRVGDGTTSNRFSPVLVTGISNVTKIAAGGWHSMAFKADGTVWTWGDNDYGQLGDGTYTERHVPTQISGIGNVAMMRAGEFHSAVLKTDGTVWTWGGNNHGALGDGTTTFRTTAVQVTGISGVNTIACGYEHTLALKNDGTLWAWGDNGSGQLGNGSTTMSTSPVQSAGLCAGSLAGIADHAANALAMDLYPNPSNGNFTIALTNIQDATVHVFNINGQEVFHQVMNDNQQEISLEQLPAGLYVVTVSSAQASGSKRLLIQK